MAKIAAPSPKEPLELLVIFVCWVFVPTGEIVVKLHAGSPRVIERVAHVGIEHRCVHGEVAHARALASAGPMGLVLLLSRAVYALLLCYAVLLLLRALSLIRAARGGGGIFAANARLTGAAAAKTTARYLAKQAGGAAAAGGRAVEEMVNDYYELSTDFYEAGWGSSVSRTPSRSQSSAQVVS